MANDKELEKSTKIKRGYLAWKKKQPKGDRTSFAGYVKAMHPGYKEPKSKPKAQSTASKIKGRKKRQSGTIYGALSKKEVDRLR